MKFERLSDLLETKSLYFSRADDLGDRFEGAMPLANIRIREDQIEKALPRYPELEERRAKVKAEILSSQESFGKTLPRRMFISCWHMRNHESDFWHHYDDRETTICIRSTYRKLRDLTAPFSTVGVVRYGDYQKDYIPEAGALPFGPFFFKRRAYEHESEVRVVVWWVPAAPAEMHSPPDGLTCPIDDLESFVDAIIVSPYAKPDFEETVQALLARYSLRIPLQESSLRGEPLY